MVPTKRLLLFGLILLIHAASARSDDPILPPQDAAPRLTGQVLIVVGLPGDKDHEKRFAGIVKQWRGWLTEKLGFRGEEIRVISGNAAKEGDSDGPATREGIEAEAARLKKAVRPDDRLWVFFLGHANFDTEHAWLHIPGPDLNEEEIGKLFAGIECREQVFWMTTPESGRFLKNLAAKGRTVISATRASGEDNETEFPEALASLANRSADELDIDKDGKLSLLELYYRVIIDVQQRYNADKRLSTEHALLDDNGDGVGVEQPLANDEDKQNPTADGVLSHHTILPYPAASKEKTAQPVEREDPKS